MNIKPVYGNEARKGLFTGIEMLANAVKVTLGPLGRNVMMRKMYEGIHGTKDGVTVAKDIEFSDELHNMGAQAVKQASQKTAKDAGDGTTTSTLLAYKMVELGLKHLDGKEGDKINVMQMKLGMEKACSDIVADLKDTANKLKEEDIESVATISANNDSALGKVIAYAFSKVGVDGNIKVEESRTSNTYVDIIQGLQFDKGYLSPYFVTDSDNMQAIFESGVKIIVCADKITQIEEVDPIMDWSVRSKCPVIIIADDVSNEALGGLVMRKLRGESSVVAVKAPYYGVRRREYFEDLCAMTGATLISKDYNRTMDDFVEDYFGGVEKAIVTESTTFMVNGSASEDELDKYVEVLESIIPETEYEKERLNVRIAMLTAGVGVLKVGASSEVEMKEKKDRIDDALNATRAAIEEGIIPGGGIALYKLCKHYTIDGKTFSNDSFLRGYQIVREACILPAIQILLNAGYNEDEFWDKEKGLTDVIGYNPITEQFENFLEKGIIDPVKVTRVALENAVSVASTILTTECVLVNEDLQQEEQQLPQYMR